MAKTKAEIQRAYAKRTGYAAQIKYDKTSTRSYLLKVMMNTEQDILEKLDSVPNKSGYIKQLIRKDIAESKDED